MNREGLYFQKADNDRDQGKMQVHKRLKIVEDVDPETGEVVAEVPQVRIFNNCKGFWRTFPSLRQDERNPEAVDTTQEDHIYDEFRYMCMARPIRPKKVEQIPAGSFRAERMKLIRAKAYAKRHGVSIAVAYNRTR